MSGLDLYESENSDRLSQLKPTDTIEPGIFDGFIRGTGMETMRQLARTGRAVGMAGAVAPIMLDKMLAKDNLSGVTLTDRYFKAMDDTFEPAIKAWTPEPNEVGVAGQVTGTLLALLPMVMANPALAIANMQMGTAQDLVQQHGEEVSAAQAVGAGLVMSAGLGLGIKVPIFGQSLWQRLLLGGVGFNVIQGAAMRGAAGMILEDTPAAEQFKALDPLELTIDALLGAGFGAIAHMSPAARAEGEAAWKKIEQWGKNMTTDQTDALMVMRQAQHSNVDTLPGKPTTPEALNGHVEKVKAAIDQTLRGEPVNVENIYAPRAADMPADESAYISEKTYKDSLRKQYIKDDGSVVSSRETPSEIELPEIGAWRIDDHKGIYGREVAQLREVPIDQLEAPELSRAGEIDPVKRADPERYAQWLQEGKRAPPIEVLETDKGGLKITDGHRRLLAAKAAGRTTIEAWVSPAMDVPGGKLDPQGNPIRTGMTFEAAANKPAFEPVPERFVEAHESAMDLMREAERIRAEEGLPPPPDNTPAGPSKVYTAVKEALAKVVGDRLGAEYPDDFAKTIDAFYQAMARRTGRTVDQLMKMRPVEITGDQPGVRAMLEQSTKFKPAIKLPTGEVIKAEKNEQIHSQIFNRLTETREAMLDDTFAENADFGFVDAAGKYFTRDQATEILGREAEGETLGKNRLNQEKPFDIGEVNVRLNTAHPEVYTGLTMTENGGLSLDSIEVREGNEMQKGLGTKAMQDVIKVADDSGKGIILMASPKKGSGLSLDKLVAWYRRFGFEPLQEQEYSNATIMYRDANEKAQASAEDSQGTQRSSLQGADQGTPRTLYQEASPRWYSELTRQVENLKQETAPAAQWKGMLKNMKGVKAEEIEWTGLNEWLDIHENAKLQAEKWKGAEFKEDDAQPGYGNVYDKDGNNLSGRIGKDQSITYIETMRETFAQYTGKVTRQQIVDYLNSNGVKVDEVMKGSKDEPSLADPKVAKDMDILKKNGWVVETNDEGDGPMIAFVDPETGDFYTADEVRKFSVQPSDEGLPPIPKEVADAAERIERHYESGSRENPTKFGGADLQLPGAKPGSYRELLLTLPTKEGKGGSLEDRVQRGGETQFTRSHWDEANVLAHVRFNERTDADGKRVLFVEEIQSDWAQKGKKEGFARPEITELPDGYVTQELEGGTAWAVAEPSGRLIPGTQAFTKDQATRQGLQYLNANIGKIPQAPFVQKTDAWAGLVIKRMIRYAAENGFDRIAWTRGEQQVERYTNALRQVVDTIEWEKTPEGVQIVGKKWRYSEPVIDNAVRDRGMEALQRNDLLGFDTAGDALQALIQDRADWETRWDVPDEPDRVAIQALIDGTTRQAQNTQQKVVNTRYAENELSDAIGKTLAEQIRNDPGQKGVIEGNNIRVDDTGMAGFYDRIVPKIANDILKKLGGGKVGEVQIPIKTNDAEIPTFRNFGRQQEGLYDGAEQFTDGSLPQIAETNLRYESPDDPAVTLQAEVIVAGQGVTIQMADGSFVSAMWEQILFDVPERISLGRSFAEFKEQWNDPTSPLWRQLNDEDPTGGRLYPETKDEQSTQPAFEITPALKAKAMEGLPLFQKGGDQPRGYFEYGDQKPYRIGLTEDANKSTPLHEASHFFLQMTKDLAAEPDASPVLKDLVSQAFKWLGITEAEYDKLTFEEQRPYHERWARAGEAYFREGRAPTPELKGAFERFKDWLMEVYKTLTQLGVKIDDDFREIMDTMLGKEPALKIPEAKVETKSPLLKAIKELGGMDKQAMEDITGEKRFGKGVKGIPWGLFKEGGLGIDDLASQLRDMGWPIPEDDVDGGVQTLKDLVKSELEGDRTLRAGEDPQGKPMEEADAEQIMARAAEQEEQAAERYDFQNTPEYQAEIARIRSERDWALSKALAGEGDFIGAEARRVTAENPDMAIEVGVKEDGTADTMTAREYLDQANAEYEQAVRDADLYREAGDCLLGVD